MPPDDDTYSGFPERLEAALEQSCRDRAAQEDTCESLDAEIAFDRQEAELSLGMVEMFLRMCEDRTGTKLREGCAPGIREASLRVAGGPMGGISEPSPGRPASPRLS